MHNCLKRFLTWALLASCSLVFSACGGGGGGGSEEMTAISGTAIKGPIKGALVQVFKLNGNGTRGELLASGTSGNDASYSIQIPKAKAAAPLLLTVSGQSGAKYTSESKRSDIDFTPAESFNAVLDTFDPAKKYTVSPLTDAAYQLLQRFLTDNPSSTANSKIISAANARIAAIFNVSDILADSSSDPAYLGSLAIIDQMISDSKVIAPANSTLQTMNLINQAFVDVTQLAYRNFVTALTKAATTVAAINTSVPATVINAIVATAANPPTEPVWTDATAPAAVRNLQAVAGSETTTSFVTLYWSVATTTGKNLVAGYDVYRDGKKIASVASTSYIDKSLALATTHTYYVVVFDAAGNRALPSAEVTATTPSAPNLSITVGGQLSSGLTSLSFKDIIPPSTPSNLAASTTAIDTTTSSVRLIWVAATDNVAVTGYDLYRDGSKIGSVPQTSYTDSSVTSGLAHSYTAIAFDAAGNRSAASAALSVTPAPLNAVINIGGQLSSDTATLPIIDTAPPAAPSNLAASTTAITATTSSVRLTWSAATDNVAVTGYDVYRGASKIGTTTLTSYSDPSLTSGVAYSYTVIAYDAGGNRSTASAPISITPAVPNLSINVGGQIS